MFMKILIVAQHMYLYKHTEVWNSL